MKQRVRKRKCKQCQDFFIPDHRNARHHKFCSKPECRKASKARSQRKWLEKPANKEYFKSPYHVHRVQLWRKDHPDYWRKAPDKKNALQDSLIPYPKSGQEVMATLDEYALQEILMTQPAVFIGLIAQLTGSTLQDDIALSAQRMRQLGNDILNCKPQNKGEGNDIKTPNMSGTNQKGPTSVQLDRPPSGP